MQEKSSLAVRNAPFSFDKEDMALLTMVNSVLASSGVGVPFSTLANLFEPSLHPNGIKRLAVSREIRIAYAVVNLLTSLEDGGLEERLKALRTLRDEVMYTSATELRTNTGRVLTQIIKDLVRAHGDIDNQKQLAHDFRIVSSGNPLIVRKMLLRYNLLEMPEDGSQLTFDNHVHDSHSKGRKTPTHLIMDAWIKGIKSLTVVYYNHVEEAPARELLEAARIMGINTRIGIEFSGKFYDRSAHFTWTPHQFASPDAFVDFLHKPQIAHLMKEGLTASKFREKIIFELLENFNQLHLDDINRAFGVVMPPLDLDKFDAFVGIGQASRLHLAEFIYRSLLPYLDEKKDALRKELEEENHPRAEECAELIRKIETLAPEDIQYTWLTPEMNKELADPDNPGPEYHPPALLRNSIATMVNWVADLHTEKDITLALTNLSAADAAEILFDCGGEISHVEIFNYKDYVVGRSPHIRRINSLQRAVNSGNALDLKRILRGMLRLLKHREPENIVRHAKFENILRSIPRLQGFYATTPLGARIGSDSSSRSKRFFSMGFAFLPTLSRSAKATIKKNHGFHVKLPLYSFVHLRVDYLPKRHYGILGKSLVLLLSLIPFFANMRYYEQRRWVARSSSTKFSSKGNIVSLGYSAAEGSSQQSGFDAPASFFQKCLNSWTYLSTSLKIFIRIFVGLMVATFTFMNTQSSPFLIFFGGSLWLGITLFRNILQSVLGGGGLRRPSTQHWNDYVSWNRIADSLFFTGFSVPLLELLVRIWFLRDICGVTATSNPFFAYSTIAIANGLYISSHNFYRGLPKEAIIGNLFRSALAIPTSIGLSFVFLQGLTFLGIAEALLLVQSIASIISKISSDTVAALIEGFADRANNIRNRSFDYKYKLDQIFSAFNNLELLLPDHDFLELLQEPQKALGVIRENAPHFEEILFINALDLMYFWYYQPRAQNVFKKTVRHMTLEERKILLYSQKILSEEKEVSLLLVEGMLGRSFTKSLAFYLNNARAYLASMATILEK